MNITRSTTKRINPPGGASSISFGDAHSSTPKNVPAPGSSAPTPAPSGTSTPKSPTEPVETPAGMKKMKSSTGGQGMLIGLAVSGADAGGTPLQAAKRKLRSLGVISVRVYEVNDPLQLPFACESLVQQAGCTAVVALAGIPNTHGASSNLYTSLIQALMEVGMRNGTPVLSSCVLFDSDEAALETAAISTAQSAVNLVNMKQGKPNNADRMPLTEGSAAARSAAAALASGEATEAVPSTLCDLLKKVKDAMKSKGANGIVGMSRKFRIMDDNGNGSLDMEEFSKAIPELGLEMTDEEIKQIFDFFDEDNSGDISFDEFLFALRGELNLRRSQLVLAAFALMDKDKSGEITIEDVVGCYDASKNPEVQQGKKTAEECLAEFLDTFDAGEKDGKVTPAEWCRYYGLISASIDEDDYFELMIRNAWHMSGGEGWCANSTCKRVLVNHADGKQTVEEIQNDLGMKPDDKDAMMQALKDQGLDDVVGIELYGSMDSTEPPAAGAQPAGAKAAKVQSLPKPPPPFASDETPLRPPKPAATTVPFDEQPLPVRRPAARRQCGGGDSSIVFG